MALNFPNTPALNDIFTSGTSSYKWDGTVWISYISPSNTPVTQGVLTGKGALISASSANTPATLSAGTNDYILTSSTSSATGLAWRENTSPLNQLLVLGT